MDVGARQQIMNAAEKLLQTKGLARVTTKELARETGLSEGALYRHFEHKEDVFLAVLSQTLPVLAEEMSQAVPGEGTVRGNLAQIALAAMHSYAQLIPLAASFFADTDLLARFALLLHEAGGPEKLFERVAAYVDDEQRLGRIEPSLPAMSVTNLLLGPCFQRVFIRQVMGQFPNDADDHRFVDDLIDVLSRAIFPGE